MKKSILSMVAVALIAAIMVGVSIGLAPTTERVEASFGASIQRIAK